MSIQKKILSMTIGPVVLLGLLSIFFMLTTDTQFDDGGNEKD